MKTRRQFLKHTSLAALAGVLGCETATDATGAADTSGGDAADADPTTSPDTSAGSDTTVDLDVGELDAANGGTDVEDASPIEADVKTPDAEAPDVEVDPVLPEYEYTGEPGPVDLFQHGVASGDPLTDRVILWTRTTGAVGPVPVFFEVARDENFEHRVLADWAEASAATDFTCKVDAAGLKPGYRYFYRFQALGRMSPVGKTRTLPGSTVIDRVRFAVGSCADYGAAYYHAYRDISEQDLDAVVFLGDYIYEYADSNAKLRHVEPKNVLRTLADYRTRYGHYRTDPWLQAAHAAHPWIIVWDDHETANNAWMRGDSAGDSPEAFAARHAAASQAWREWLPVRVAEGEPIYREFEYGDLARLVMLDTRIEGREEPVDPNYPDGFDADSRRLISTDQEAWLDQKIVAAKAAGQWLILGQQVMMAPLTTDGVMPLNYDQWDGYPAARNRLFASLAKAGTDDLVVLTGDIHSSWGNDLPLTQAAYDPETGAGSVGVEFVAPGIGSGFFIDIPELIDLAMQVNPHVRFADITRRGYVLLDVDADRAQGDFRLVDDATALDSAVKVAGSRTCIRGTRRLVPT